MNSVREIARLNKRELENNVSTEGSWHRDYDSAYVYIGGLSFDLTEGDIITIFSQFGEPTFVKLVRDKETGKSRGFAFLKYEDQRSTDLAVDNLGGATVLGRVLKVDHTNYKRRDDEEDGDGGGADSNKGVKNDKAESEEERPMIKEERELADLIQNHDEDDPMKEYLVQEKREEVKKALAKSEKGESGKRKHKHRHREHRDNDRHGRGNESQRGDGRAEDTYRCRSYRDDGGDLGSDDDRHKRPRRDGRRDQDDSRRRTYEDEDRDRRERQKSHRTHQDR